MSRRARRITYPIRATRGDRAFVTISYREHLTSLSIASTKFSPVKDSHCYTTATGLFD
jgi:hypothetical protein